MSTATFNNPGTPFETLLSNVQPGMTINVRGRRTPGDRFAIQFKTGPGPHADLAFRFCANWVHAQPEVLGNSRIANQWGSGIIYVKGTSPFIMGQSFQVMIMVERDGYKVAVNGAHFATFPHRVGMHLVKYLEVETAIAIEQVSIYNQRSAGGAAPSSPMTIHNPMNEQPIAIPLPNIRDHTVTVNGVPGHARFSIQFLTATNPPNIFFFFNPRLGQRVVARNACLQNAWGAEETTIAGGFPFAPGRPFQVEISVDRRCFRVSVGGVYLCEFNHRQRPLNQINRMKFAGNVKISSVSFR